MIRKLILYLVLINLIKCDTYLTELQSDCILTRRPYKCAKYNFVKFIDKIFDVSNDYLTTRNSTGFVKIIKMPKRHLDIRETHVARQNEIKVSEYTQMLNFLKRRIYLFLSSHGLGFSLPDGIEVVEEKSIEENEVEPRRRHRRNRFFMVPILVLAKLFKINILLGIVLFGILVLKKILLAAAFIFPAIIVSVKNACRRGQDRFIPPDSNDLSWGWNRFSENSVTSRYPT